jgi:hypothetical protein
VSIAAVHEPGFALPAPAPLSAPIRAKPETTDGPSPFARVLEGLGREIQRGESLMRSAVDPAQASASISPVGLIALQAGVYRYAEAVDLASRIVDRATGSVKTVIQGQ